MYQSGMTVEEIAAERGFSPVTIEGHLSYYVGKGILDIRTFVSLEDQQLIEKAIAQVGTETLRAIKDLLPEHISFGAIRMVVALVGS